jgi:hypothetical protein
MVLLILKAAPRVCPAGHHVPAAPDGRPAGRVREVLPPQGQEGRDQTQTDEAETEAIRKVHHTPLFLPVFRIRMWIRIRIGSGFNQVSGSGFGIRIRDPDRDPGGQK